MSEIKFRAIVNDDMYLLSEIADKMDIVIPSHSKEVKGKPVQKSQEEYGMEIITALGKKLYKAKDEINQLLSSLSGLSVEEIKKMPVGFTVKALTSIVKQEGVVDFFK
ncbi:hypothetical protein [Paenibacillus sp. sgz302251]|uniref:hypothetical protein n=1 Tax=Paenibacillus sp. sgz302251 TaxID=3414493 RepID=UPI003C7A91D9